MGRQQRTKQADPAPFAGSSAHPHVDVKKGKKKQNIERRASQGLPGKIQKPKVSIKPANKGQNRAGTAAAGGGRKRAAKELEDSDDDDLQDLQAEDDYSDDEDISEGEDKNLEAARSALFGDEDLKPPSDSDDEDDQEDGTDEFDLDRASDDDEEEASDDLEDEFDLEGDDNGEGVTLEDFEIDTELPDDAPVLSKKQAKKAERMQYNSDDEAALPSKLVAAKGVSRKPGQAPTVANDDEEDEEALGAGMEDDELVDEDGEVGEESDEDVQEGQLDDLRAVEKRMRTAARVLSNWKELGSSAGKSRSDLVDQLVGDICQYHGYTRYLAEKLFDIFPVDEALQFFTSSDTPRPLTLRVNTLKARRRDLAQALINRGVNLQPLEGGWSKVGLQVFAGGGVPIGATPEYLAGHYILQSASSFLPVVALAPQPHERVLDMSAAPGGKTTYMSALMGNTGEVWANDSSRGRIKGLGGNIARLGCRNVIITNVDGREYPKVMGGFDRVLLDAPCSGTGVISKDQSVKINKTERDFTLLSHLQKQLVLCAIDSVTPNSENGGFAVYSTCSVTTEENEAVVSYALKKRPHAKLVDTGLPFGKEGFQRFRGKEFGKNMHLTRRFYPHVHNMDGFYVAKFKVGKPAKKVEGQEDDYTEPFKPVMDEDASEAEDGPAFDDEADAEIIAESKRRALKVKGINPKAVKPSPNGTKTVAKAANGSGPSSTKKAKKA